MRVSRLPSVGLMLVAACGLIWAVPFLWMLIAGNRNMFIADFGRSLGLWQAECAWFLSGDSDERPFPWRPWPKG